MNPLAWLADRWLHRTTRVPPSVAPSHYRKHRLGFYRGYAVGAVTGVLVAFAYHALTL